MIIKLKDGDTMRSDIICMSEDGEHVHLMNGGKYTPISVKKIAEIMDDSELKPLDELSDEALIHLYEVNPWIQEEVKNLAIEDIRENGCFGTLAEFCRYYAEIQRDCMIKMETDGFNVYVTDEDGLTACFREKGGQPA